MAVATAEVLREGSARPVVERLNPQLDEVEVGDRLRITLRGATICFGEPGCVDITPTLADLPPTLGEHLLVENVTTEGIFLTIEGTVIKGASPILLAIVLVSVLTVLAGFFVIGGVETVERIGRAIGAAIGAALAGAIEPVAKSSFGPLLLLGLGALAAVRFLPARR